MNMNRHGLPLSLLLLAWLGAGCIAERALNSPGATGVVRDVQNQKPLRGARVAVSRLPEPTSIAEALGAIRPPVAVTDAEGRFTIEPERQWRLMDADYVELTGSLIVQRDGYQPAIIPLTSDPPLTAKKGIWHDGTARWSQLGPWEFEILLKPSTH
ncbi:MAG: carboxypeptidase-like regulatory domain-containing protein [Verrucomicrobiota bacterium]